MAVVITDLVTSVAELVGKRVARDWPFMAADDVTQEILLVACTRADTYNGMNEGQLRDALTREAVSYCAKERTDYVTRTARYLYTPAEVRVLLAVAVETVGVEFDAPTRDGYVAAPDRGNIVVSLWDLRAALADLRPQWRDILLRRAEGDGITDPDARTQMIQRGWIPLSRSEHMTYSRALDRVTHILNRTVNRATGEHDGPGSRKAIPNARAYAVTHDDRDGG